MATEELDNYKKLHNRFMVLLIEYHNHHCDFINSIKPQGRIELRRVLKKLKLLEHEMSTSVRAVFNESRSNKAEKVRIKQDIKLRKQNESNNNRPTKSII
jgi:uncharacterized protein (UPF0335 family)